MRGLSLILFLLLVFFIPPSDSPHEKDLKFSCDACHTSEGWKIDRQNITFKHEVTDFPLQGLHQDVNCISCHKSLIFMEADPNCVSCHTDMHEQSVGFECARCHTTNSWIVENITEIHQLSRFPLLGAHNTADCNECHESASTLVFGPLQVDCFSCHQEDYYATTSPNHAQNDYSTDCTQCHQLNAFSWTGVNFTHTFFPLTQGHEIQDCSKCHQDLNDYSNISSECISCHQNDYNNADSPNHIASNFTTDCKICHSTAPGWKPADFANHDLVFPIYSGEHEGEWNSCIDCHNIEGNYSIFTCISCHEHNQSEMNDEHDEVGGYFYNSNACFECHPNGSGDNVFNHNTSNFPLTGAHTTTECSECHTNGYAGTTTDCGECHITAYNQTSNPNHIQVGISLTCADCHSTQPGWKPADFNVHDQLYFPIYSGEHAGEWADCIECHTSPDNYVLFTCIDCHDHNQVDMDEEHNGISGYVYENNACLECHPDGTGEGAFDHNLSNFPLTGAHTYTDCIGCHSNGYSGTPTYCAECHTENFNQTTNPNHLSLSLDNDCASCHSTQENWQPATFDVHNNFYILAGAHVNIANECVNCHNGDYNNTPNTCYACHTQEYNQTTNPPHASAQFSTECLTCHTENAWTPSTFDHDGQYFPIYSGKHNNEWEACIDCHINPSNYAIFSCIDCHEHNQSDMNNDHNEVNGYVWNSIACLECHPNGQDLRNIHRQINIR